MCVTYVGIVHFKNSPPAAEFKWDRPLLDDNGVRTHFRLNFDSLRTRIRNLWPRKKKDGSLYNLSEELKALQALLPESMNYHIQRI